MSSPIMLRLPHTSNFFPEDPLQNVLLSDQEIQEELNHITDHATDRIFQQVFPEVKAIVFPVSWFFVDLGCFSDDSQQLMSQVGKSVTYTKESLCQSLRAQPNHGKIMN